MFKFTIISPKLSGSSEERTDSGSFRTPISIPGPTITVPAPRRCLTPVSGRSTFFSCDSHDNSYVTCNLNQRHLEMQCLTPTPCSMTNDVRALPGGTRRKTGRSSGSPSEARASAGCARCAQMLRIRRRTLATVFVKFEFDESTHPFLHVTWGL